MGKVVDLHSQPAELAENTEFLADLCRYKETLVTESFIRRKWRLAEDVWEKLGSDDDLILKVEEKSLHRVRDGSYKREKSQQLVTKAPDVLSGILLDAGANSKHRIDSAKLLNDFSANGPAGVPASDRFQITINLSGDGADHALHFDKPITITAGDTDPYNDGDDDTNIATPWGLIATAKKQDDGGNDNTI